MTLPAVAIFGAVLLWQSSADVPRASISGRVVSAETGEAIKGASVRLFTTTGSQPFGASAVSGPDGSFSFQGLAPAIYSLGAAKSGHWAAQPLPIRIPAANNQAYTAIEIKFHRSPAITGRLRDADGLPVIGAEVTLHRIVWSEGRRLLVSAGSAHTDDRGEYRVHGFYAGRFLISAAPLLLLRGADRSTPARTFYPTGGRTSEALPLDIRWGQELVGINFVLAAQPTFEITGRVIDAATGGPCRTCRIQTAALESGYEFQLPPAGVTAAGVYRLGGLMPGAYRVSVAQNIGGRLVVASQRVDITDTSVAGVDLLAGVLSSVVGRVVLQSTPADLKLSDLEIHFRPVDRAGSPEESEVAEDLSFQAQLSALTYNVSIEGLPEGAYLKGLRLGNQDLSAPQIEAPRGGSSGEMEVVVAFDSAILAGKLKPAGSSDVGRPPADVSVVLFPQEGESPFLVPRSVSADANGGFQLKGIVPGKYLAHAVAEQDLPEWQDPDFRRRSPVSGSLIELRPSSQQSVELVVAPLADVR